MDFTNTQVTPTVNQTDRFEDILLGEGQQKIEVDEDHVSNGTHTTIFTINKEDHTLGNLISQKLLKYTSVEFAAYQMEHPMDAKFKLRVTTDGSITPRDVVVKCCRDAISEQDVLKSSFTDALRTFRSVQKGDAEGNAGAQTEGSGQPPREKKSDSVEDNGSSNVGLE